MPVNTTHPQYEAHASQWKRCRDVYAGQDAVHAAGADYLPKLKDQTPDDYNGYVKRATFYNASYRTMSGLVGMLFRQPPKQKVPAVMEEMLNDITLSGIPLQVLTQEVATDALDVGRVGILVDYPKANPSATLADAKLQNLRPMMKLYKAESILNWASGSVNNKIVLTRVVLKESATIQTDEFTSKEEDRWRVLDLINEQYQQRLFEKKADGTFGQIGEDIIPTMNSKPLDYIPFVFISTDGTSSEVTDPPLIDLVNVNLSHYRSTADYEHGAHFTGLPTPVVSGVKESDLAGQKLYIGSATAWVFPNKDAKATYLEFTGTGLKAIEDILTRKETQMAILGARMLEPQKKGVETAETAGIHRKGEESMLSMIAQSISMGMEQALKWFAAWAGANPDEVEFDINRDFFPAPMTPQQLAALIAAWQAGAISDQTLFDRLQQGEVINEDVLFEEEQARINNSAPRLMGQSPDGSAPPPLPSIPNQTHVFNIARGPKSRTITDPKGGKYTIQDSEG